MKKQFMSMPTRGGDRPAEVFARFTYDFAGGGSVRVIVSQLQDGPIAVTEERTRYKICDIDAYQLTTAKGDYAIAAGMALDAVARKHGVVKILKVIDGAPTYEGPEL